MTEVMDTSNGRSSQGLCGKPSLQSGIPDLNNSLSEYASSAQQTSQKTSNPVYEINGPEARVDYLQRLIQGQQRFLKDSSRYPEHEQLKIELLQ
ncbi:hypothetical protein CDAR_199661 [Caerostris darwini]|uniref:Uncharacterized protein n=1 Tax=Caerostris darwini TaxID=1538125 RepID=A0AAV4V6A4_9ARAC|nr:hypothetical protein CDAR_199661 [Caerostris darwini]